MNKDQIYVWGGVFTSGSFARLESVSAEQVSGPYADRATAERVCIEGMRKNIDVCWHRLFVLKGAEVEARRASALPLEIEERV